MTRLATGTLSSYMSETSGLAVLDEEEVSEPSAESLVSKRSAVTCAITGCSVRRILAKILKIPGSCMHSCYMNDV